MTDEDTRLTTYRNHKSTPYIVGDIPATLDSEDGVSHSEIEQVIALERTNVPEMVQGFHDQVPQRLKLTCEETMRREEAGQPSNVCTKGTWWLWTTSLYMRRTTGD